MEKVLLIVESPTKARTIKKFLPANFMVEASVGHIRDLPQSAADIPEKFKHEEWARIGIDIKNDFAPLYITPKGKSKVVSQLKKLLKDADVLYLATDEDREGESISWHLVEVLKPAKMPVRRMVFHEITRTAIQDALDHPRDLDLNLVKAQETRRVLDRLYGFTLSPLLWKKIAYGLSAGRVQSPGLKLLVEREFERSLFKKSVYWGLKANLSPLGAGPEFDARLISHKGMRVAGGKDFDPDSGALKSSKSLLVLGEEEANTLLSQLGKATWRVLELTEKETLTRPAPPFITSTLQQEGNRKLGLSSRDTMRIAQKLYEEGLITYMRTDSPTISTEGIQGSRKAIEETWGKEFLSPTPRQYTSKSQNAQEAHEAIRPAGATFVHPDEAGLSGKDKSLYEMIWKRTLATQMADAKKLSISVSIEAGDTTFQANGSRILFPGFLRVYVEGSDDPDAALEDKEVILPALKQGQELNLNGMVPERHETKPPARYTEASLIQRLEKEGIGRPSTYSTIISVLYEREYARKVGLALVPTYTGVTVAQFLEKNFSRLVSYRFTSEMEESLDNIALGKVDRSAYLEQFYLGETGLEKDVEHRERLIKPEESRSIRLPQLDESIDIRIGRFGPYVVSKDALGNEIHASIPEEIAPGDLSLEQVQNLITIQKEGPASLGKDPVTGLDVFCRIGRYGPYLQLGEKTDEDEKPKRAPLPKDKNPKDLTLEDALRYLSLPRVLGVHPVTNKEISTNLGRFGPYVVHDGEFRSLKKDDNVYSVTLERALELLAEEKKSRSNAKVIKELGNSPDGKKMQILDGSYGPYLKAGTLNISLPEEKRSAEAAASITEEEAAALYAEAQAKPKKKKTRG